MNFTFAIAPKNAIFRSSAKAGKADKMAAIIYQRQIS
jgi:hypothetical protein